MANLGHGSDTMLDEHDSPQWYDIVQHGFALGFPKRPHTKLRKGF